MNQSDVAAAVERLENLRQTRHLTLTPIEQEAVWSYINTILAALREAQGEIEKYRKAYCSEDKARMKLLAEYDDAQIEVENLLSKNKSLRADISAKDARIAELKVALANVTNQERERYADALIAMGKDNKSLRYFVQRVAESTCCNMSGEAYDIMKETSHE